jgi:hypothetical protein
MLIMVDIAEDPSADVLRAVREVDWAAYAMPPSEQWYEGGDVLRAFRRLVAVASQQEADDAYNAMLFAIGNNHAGCLYPAAAPAVPLLIRVAREYQGWARQAALEILIECVSFDVDRDQFTDPSGQVVRTKDVIVAAVQGMREDLERLAQEETDYRPARALLELLDDELATGQ